MDQGDAQAEGSQARAESREGVCGEIDDAGAVHGHRWRRVLLLLWVGVMTAVVVTGVVGFLAYFFLLMR